MISNQMNIKQLMELIYDLKIEEKQELSRFLDELLLEQRIKKFIESKKNIPISLEEISKEVEFERAERYKC